MLEPESREGTRYTYKGMQFAAAVKEPQTCCGVRVADIVMPSLTQVLPDLLS